MKEAVTLSHLGLSHWCLLRRHTNKLWGWAGPPLSQGPWPLQGKGCFGAETGMSLAAGRTVKAIPEFDWVNGLNFKVSENLTGGLGSPWSLRTRVADWQCHVVSPSRTFLEEEVNSGWVENIEEQKKDYIALKMVCCINWVWRVQIEHLVTYRKWDPSTLWKPFWK